MRCLYIHVRMAKIQITEKRNSRSLLVGIQNDIAILEDILAVSYKTNIFLPCNPAIIVLGIYPNELKTYVHIKTYTWKFSHNCQNMKTTKMFFSCDWKSKLWYILTIKYYSVLKNELTSHEKGWGQLKCTLLSERS